MLQLLNLDSLHIFLICLAFGVNLAINKYYRKTKQYIPTNIIIGIILFVLINANKEKINFGILSNIAYHLFNLSVISLGLITQNNSTQSTKKSVLHGAIWMTVVFTIVLCIQSLIGYGTIELYNLYTGKTFFAGFGLLSGHGLAQGAGQILSIGKIWEFKYDIQGTISIGLIYVAVGYLLSIVIGIPFTNSILKARKQKTQEPDFDLYSNQMKKPQSLKAFLYQISLISIIYLISLCTVFVLEFSISHSFLANYKIFRIISEILPSMLFAIGLFYTSFYKAFIKTKQVYSNEISVNSNTIEKTITSGLIDLLILASFASIEASLILHIGIAIFFVILANSLVTLLFFYILKSRNKYDLKEERIVSLLGTSFGSLANGLMLLKILDPKIKTSVHFELALMNFYSAFTIGHLVILVTIINEFNSISTILNYYIFTLLISILLLVFLEKRNKTII